MRVLVTGGAGFIGSHLVEKLVSRGYTVRVLDDLSSGKLENLSSVMDGIEFIRGDVRDPPLLLEAMRGVDVVYHLAAKVSVAESYANPDLYWEVNVLGTRGVLEAAAMLGVGKVVYASSAAVYGNPVYLPVDERHPLNPVNPYGESKLEGESLTLAYACRRGFEAVIVRLFNVYGPRQEGNPYAGVIQKFIERVKAGTPPVIYGDGRQTRDFVYVEDAVDGILQVAEESEGVSTVNIGSGVETSINELAETVIALYGLRGVKPVYAEPRPGDVRRSVADVRLARRLGWEPRYSLVDGLKETIKYARKRMS